MQLPLLIDFSLVLIVASTGLKAKDQNWIINVTQSHRVLPGQSVTIQCSFTYPEEHYTENVQVYWKMPGKSACRNNDKDPRAFIFHINTTCVEKGFKGRTQLIGQPNDGNCTLRINNVTKEISNIYVRISVNKENYSFIQKRVTISVIGSAAAATSGPDLKFATTEEPPQNSSVMHMAIFIPFAGVILLVAVILILIRHKRSRSLTREESKYYVNFSRALADTPQRKLSGVKAEQTMTEQKVIDDPVYINLEAPTTEMHPDTDHCDHIYGNVDYSTSS